MLRETGLWADELSKAVSARGVEPKVLERLAWRVRNAFDAQLNDARLDTGPVKKINVYLYSGAPVPRSLPPWAPLRADDRVRVINSPVDVEAFASGTTQDQMSVLLGAHIRGMTRLAEWYSWDVEQFLVTGRRAQDGGLLATLHREKQNRRRTLVAVVDGHVDDVAHLTFAVLDRCSREVVLREERTYVGDYWDLLDLAHDIRWAGDSVELRQRERAGASWGRWTLRP